MAKQGVFVDMTGPEKMLGGGLLAVYFVVLPTWADPISGFMERLSGISVDRNAACWYILFALALLAFWGYFKRSARAFLDHMGHVLVSVGIGLAAFYGLNEIVYRVFQLFSAGRDNLNDQAILARLEDSPGAAVLILVFLAPVVEEAIFRGYIFGNLRETSRTAAYAISCLLFAFLHVWPFAAVRHDFTYLLLTAQYLVPGLVMAWTFERSGTLWGSILLHCAVNGLSVWSVM